MMFGGVPLGGQDDAAANDQGADSAGSLGHGDDHGTAARDQASAKEAEGGSEDNAVEEEEEEEEEAAAA
eukprot:CAMPEP_0202054768 /NCGR_PEP_ID=MMETSP0963-20130614/10063_1 /ASSEMBLY_ACC=CAM_ASM_000494 /TAXON_ID=4773 /ORGANISM="Schizochytrium aggregatum, Strain ATCC28209" /LENGTH=68 /DNA_ID=CAMNT_0048620247 /DNA_START=99 /DNA_END=302 /DNA_ORIENTATION=-